ncbi:MAG: hypothetical protein ABIH34_06250 [Nanoarchaeota archaeon]
MGEDNHLDPEVLYGSALEKITLYKPQERRFLLWSLDFLMEQQEQKGTERVSGRPGWTHPADTFLKLFDDDDYVPDYVLAMNALLHDLIEDSKEGSTKHKIGFHALEEIVVDLILHNYVAVHPDLKENELIFVNKAIKAHFRYEREGETNHPDEHIERIERAFINFRPSHCQILELPNNRMSWKEFLHSSLPALKKSIDDMVKFMELQDLMLQRPDECFSKYSERIRFMPIGFHAQLKHEMGIISKIGDRSSNTIDVDGLLAKRKYANYLYLLYKNIQSLGGIKHYIMNAGAQHGRLYEPIAVRYQSFIRRSLESADRLIQHLEEHEKITNHDEWLFMENERQSGDYFSHPDIFMASLEDQGAIQRQRRINGIYDILKLYDQFMHHEKKKSEIPISHARMPHFHKEALLFRGMIQEIASRVNYFADNIKCTRTYHHHVYS